MSTYKAFASEKGLSEGSFNNYMNETGYQIMTNEKLSTGEKNQNIMDGLQNITTIKPVAETNADS